LTVGAVENVIASRRFLFDFLVLLFVAALIAVFRLSLDFLHLRSLILEPDLDYANGQTGIFRERFSDFPARLW
jgi:hypothetical protein